MTQRSLVFQLALTNCLVAGCAVIVTLISAYFVYFLTATYPWCQKVPMLPNQPEIVWWVGTIGTAFVLAAFASIRMSRRVLQPINVLTRALRAVAAGDLSARASDDGVSIGEAASLLRDFNFLAEKLERMSAEMVKRNAAVAHELRTPVAVLRGRLQGLAESVFEPDPKLFASLVYQTEGLSRIIEDLRTISLTDGGKLRLNFRPEKLDVLVLDLIQLLEPAFRTSQMTLLPHISAVTVNCDAVLVRQALMAIFTNAQRYADPGPIFVSVSRDDEYAILSVRDTGPGIPAELRPHVFESFRRVDESRSRMTGGSGLGLAVVRAITEAHHGRVSCEAGEGGGTEFSIRLPLDHARDAIAHNMEK